MIEIILTRPLTIYNSSEPINSAVFSKAKPLRFPRLVIDFDQIHCDTSKVFASFSFIAFERKMIPFFRFSKATFLSFTFFLQILNLCAVGFLIKQLFYSSLLDMK